MMNQCVRFRGRKEGKRREGEIFCFGGSLTSRGLPLILDSYYRYLCRTILIPYATPTTSSIPSYLDSTNVFIIVHTTLIR